MQTLFSFWHLDGLMAAFLIAVCAGYIYLIDFKIIKRSVYFFIGLALIILAVASPLHFLGANYLMSAHMLSHVLLLLIAAPLLTLGIPDDLNNKLLIRFSNLISTRPWLPWMTGVCVMWFWHIPFIFNHMFVSNAVGVFNERNHYVYLIQNIHLISLVLAGIIFSWPITGPVLSRRAAPLQGVLYLSAACIFCSILGLLITFAPMGVYTYYTQIPEHAEFLHMIRNENGISAEVDQQMAGLIMWVPGCLIYLSASMYILMKYFKEKKDMIFLSAKNSNNE